MKILTLLKSLDFLGPEIKFRINKQENFKTVFGGMISILYYIAFLSFFILFGGDFFNNKNPKIVTQVLTDPQKNKTIELSNNNFFLAFRIAYPYGLIPNLNVNSTNCLLEYIIEKDSVKNITNIPIKNCEESDFVLFNIPNKISNYYCADFSNIEKPLEIGGSYDTVEFFFASLSLKIIIDQNLFNDFSDKKNATQAKKYLDLIQDGIFPQVVIPMPIFDPNNYTTPLRYEAKHVFSSLSFETYIQDQVLLSDYVVETDNGILLDSVSTMNKTGFGKMQTFNTRWNVTDYSAVYEMSIIYDKDFYFSTRQYMKFQDLLGNINGFMEMVMFVFSFLISFNSDYRLNKYIANKLIYIVDSNFKEDKKIILNNPKTKELQATENIKSSESDNKLKIRNNNSKNINSRVSQFLSNIENKTIDNIANFIENNIELVKINDDSSSLSSRNLKGDENKIDITSNKLNFGESNNNLLLSPEKNIHNQENDESLKLKINFAKKISKKNKENGKVLEYSFMDHLFRSKICKYQNNYDDETPNRIIAEKIADKVFKKFDILYYLRILNEFENVVKVIFDNYQSNLLKSFSKKEYFYRVNKEDKKIEFIRDEDKIKETDYVIKHYSQLNNSKELSVIDSKLLNFINRIISS